jgi:peptidyl-prolyl cis-trans isomerase D
VVTPLEIEQEYRKKNEKVRIEFVKIPSDKYKNEVQPTAEDLQAYFKANTARYNMPERRSLAILIADQAKLEQSANPTDADLLRAYSQDQTQFRVPESVKVRHILLKTQGKPPEEEAKIKAQADDLLKQVKAGANFGDLVKKYSEDTASVPNGGEYTIQKNGQMVPEFETAAFTMKPGESSVVKTSYGYHVMQVVSHDQARIRPFDEVKGELAAEWKKQMVAQQMQQISDKAQSMLQKDPAHPEKVAADLNMQLVRADNVEAGKPIADLGANPDFDQALTGLKKGEVTQPIALAGNKIIVAVVTDVQPSRPATLNEVEGEVRNAIIQARLVTATQNHAAELMEKAKTGGDLAKAAKSMGLEAKTSAEFARNGTVEGLGTASYVSEAFNRPDGSLVGPLNTPDGTVIAKVIAHVPADMSKLPEQRDSIRDEIKSQKARDRNMLFETGVRDALIKEGKVKIHQDVVNRLIANYRTS